MVFRWHASANRTTIAVKLSKRLHTSSILLQTFKRSIVLFAILLLISSKLSLFG
jgi:hypothetical protein